jgi:hypothetical protein
MKMAKYIAIPEMAPPHLSFSLAQIPVINTKKAVIARIKRMRLSRASLMLSLRGGI